MLQHWRAWDERWTHRLRVDHRRGWVRRLLGWLSHSGDGVVWLALPALAWWLGGAAWRQAAALVLGAVVLTAGVVFVVKALFRRRRPQGAWGQVYRKTDPYSFPSGHAARALMLGVLAWGLAPPWAAALASLWALLVAFSRVAMGVHYLSDVLAGGALGLVIGLAVLWGWG